MISERNSDPLEIYIILVDEWEIGEAETRNENVRQMTSRSYFEDDRTQSYCQERKTKWVPVVEISFNSELWLEALVDDESRSMSC